MEIISVSLTALLSVAALFIVTKIMGHKQVAQLDFFDYVSGITIGSIGAELATELEAPLRPLIALIVYGLVSVALGIFARKLPRTRKYINGSPTILLEKGKLYRENLKKSKLDLSEFMLLCRESGYFDLDEIECVIFEHNGKLSILPKAEKRPINPEDMGISVKKVSFYTELVMDGRVMSENLVRLGKDEIWLRKRLALQGFPDTKKVFLALYKKEEDSIRIYPFR